MVDFQSHYRLYAHGFTSDPPRVGVKTNRELKHEEGRKVFRNRHDRPVHDCRHEIMKEHTNREEFDAWVLSHGLVQTYQAVDEIHEKSDESSGSKKPDKLLYKIGLTGKGEGDFSYPRGICTTMDCDILVADSMNHRVQHLNQFGVFKKMVGTKGCGQLEFDEPADAVELPNGDIAVADKKNKRVQVLSEDFDFKYNIEISGEPYSLSCDRDMNMAIATTDKHVYIYNCYDAELTHSFPVGCSMKKSKGVPIQVSMSHESELFVCDPDNGYIYAYTLEGQLMHRFKPESHSPGLSVVAGDVAVTPLGQVLVVDVLNHLINLYTDKGEFLQQVLTPTDDAGSISCIALGLEGHLVATESSIGGDHCVKIFRYRQCPCHEGRPSSSKRRTPVGSPF